MARNANDLLADLDQLGVEEKAGSQSNKPSKTTPKPAKDSSNKPSNNDDDPFGDPQAQLAAKAQPTSRPATPRMSSSATSANNKSPKRAEHTPASSGPPSGRTSSEDKIRSNTSAAPVRKSGESARGYHQGVTPDDKSEEKPAQSDTSKAQTSPAPASGGGWWGSMYSAATAAVKQAETLAKEISGNEEAQRWAGQVRAIGGKNLTNLQHLSTDLRSRALPTFTTLLQHIAPPISAHERLQIHTTHDILNYPGLDPLIYQVFSRTMAQVEGGDLMVIQRGTEQRSRASASEDPQGYRGGVLGSSGGGWSDGPWWREGGVTRSLGTVPGLKEGSRLARVGAEAYAREFFDAKGGVEEAAKQATQTLSETNPVRSSDIFLAIQAISYEDDAGLFADDGRKEQSGDGSVAEPAPEKAESVVFAIYLHDPIHSLSFSTLSQPFPAKWASWLDASAGESQSGLPDSIQEIIAAGGLDPREWVAEWMEETLSLAVGVVAQRYVARRMGVGEGGLGRGKKRVEEEGMGGEAARAI
ncbi:hypothetical protein WHR41_06076 [Cladosporium halotolerans]|uniref:Maintenance of telomere capping protein 1 n=1 Tax=Cladosporium halotolerans TaxID=1052096 RepID=A0AB34KRE1_9PEZI